MCASPRPASRIRSPPSPVPRPRLEAICDAGSDADVVASLRIAGACEGLELRHVIACLDTQRYGTEADVAAEGAVAVEVGLAIDVQIAVAIGAAARAEPDEGRQREKPTVVPRHRAQLRAEVVLEDVQRLIACGDAILARRPTERSGEGKSRNHAP